MFLVFELSHWIDVVPNNDVSIMIAFRISVFLFSGISIMISANTPGDITGLTLRTPLHFSWCVLNFKMIYITWVLIFFFFFRFISLFPSSFQFSEKNSLPNPQEKSQFRKNWFDTSNDVSVLHFWLTWYTCFSISIRRTMVIHNLE